MNQPRTVHEPDAKPTSHQPQPSCERAVEPSVSEPQASREPSANRLRTIRKPDTNQPGRNSNPGMITLETTRQPGAQKKQGSDDQPHTKRETETDQP